MNSLLLFGPAVVLQAAPIFRESSSLLQTKFGNTDLSHLNSHGSHLNITILVSDGCSGSTFLHSSLHELAELHGVQVWNPGHGEFFSPQDDSWKEKPFCVEPNGKEHFWPEDNAEKLRVARGVFQGKTGCQEVISMHSTKLDIRRPTMLFFKAIGKRDIETKILSLLARPFDNMVGTHRRNILDEFVCFVRDCFLDQKHISYQQNHAVWADGTDASQVCFDRRQEELSDEEYKAWIDPAELADNLGRFDTGHLGSLQKDYPGVTDVIFPGVADVAYEDLCLFEEGKISGMHTSVQAYRKLLDGMGIPSRHDIVQQWASDFIKEHGTRMLRNHSEDIYNWKEVKKAISKTEYHWLWRG